MLVRWCTFYPELLKYSIYFITTLISKQLGRCRMLRMLFIQLESVHKGKCYVIKFKLKLLKLYFFWYIFTHLILMPLIWMSFLQHVPKQFSQGHVYNWCCIAFSYNTTENTYGWSLESNAPDFFYWYHWCTITHLCRPVDSWDYCPLFSILRMKK